MRSGRVQVVTAIMSGSCNFRLISPMRSDTVPGCFLKREDGYLDFDAAFAAWECTVPDTLHGPLDVIATVREQFGAFTSFEGAGRGRGRGIAFHPAIVPLILAMIGSPDCEPGSPVLRWASERTQELDTSMRAHISQMRTPRKSFVWAPMVQRDGNGANKMSISAIIRLYGRSWTGFASDPANADAVERALPPGSDRSNEVSYAVAPVVADFLTWAQGVQASRIAAKFDQVCPRPVRSELALGEQVGADNGGAGGGGRDPLSTKRDRFGPYRRDPEYDIPRHPGCTL